MNLEHITEDISAYLADELDQTERNRIDLHLSECEACRAELETHKRLDDLLADAKSLSPRPELLRNVIREIQPDSKTFFGRRSLLPWLAVAAVIVAVLFLLRIQKDVSVPGEVVKGKPPVIKPEISPAPKQEPDNRPDQESAPKVVTPEKKEPVPQPSPQPVPPPSITPEDAELIAKLDELENMDLISNYENLENLEIALLGEGGESQQ